MSTTSGPSSEPAVRQFGRLVISTGPERGKVFEFDDELVHIGRAAENQIMLDDPSLSAHHASLLHKNGRFAIYRPGESDVRVDGAEIPAETWIWLPNETRLQFGRRTASQFSYESIGELPPAASSAVSTDDDTEDDPPTGTVELAGSPPGRPADRRSNSRSAEEAVSATSSDSVPQRKANGESKKSSKSKSRGSAKSRPDVSRQVARFITDRGDTLVELGANGHLPELALEENATRRKAAAGPKSSSPLLMYCVLGLSFLMTMGMLLIDPQSSESSSLSRQDARDEVVRFFGNEKDASLKPWQESLRRARLAYSQRDFDTELREYRKVIDALNAEDRNPHIGVTGHLETDKELKRLIGAIIGR